METFKSFYSAAVQKELMESSHFDEIKKLVKSSVDDNIEELAKKLKAWAVEHMSLATKSGESVDMLKKIINNPIGITKQLVAAMVSKNADFPILDKKA
jgi:hydroxymethylglutaryl-CoA reductase